MSRKGAADRLGLERFDKWQRGYQPAAMFARVDAPPDTWRVDKTFRELKLPEPLSEARREVAGVASAALFHADMSYGEQQGRDAEIAAGVRAEILAGELRLFLMKETARLIGRDPDFHVTTEPLVAAAHSLHAMLPPVVHAAKALNLYAASLRPAAGSKVDFLARHFCEGVRKWWVEVSGDNHALPSAMLRFAVALWLDAGFPMPDRLDRRLSPPEKEAALTDWMRARFNAA